MAWLAVSRMYNIESAKEGITTNMGFVLLHIDDKEGTPATKIAPLMGMEPRSLTRMIAKMEALSLVYRRSDPNDKRISLIVPTPKGLEVKAVARDVVITFNKSVRNRISPEKLDVFFEVIDEINAITQPS